MADIPIRFELPGNLHIEKFISSTAKKFPLQLTAQYYAVKTFYDSFDWRLYNAGLLCEFNQSKSFSHLSLINHDTEQRVARADLEKVPLFVADLEIPLLTQQLLPLLEMRALLPITCLNLQIYQLNILNNQQKTIARLTIEEHESIKHRVTLEPIKGYDKAAARLTQFLLESLGLKTASKSVLVAALKAQGRKPSDYSSKFSIQLEPATPAHKAVKTIYRQLLQAIKLNEQGSINAIDSEFLHDFRVAVRRTRAGLSQLKTVLSDDMTCRYSEYFAWLGQITSPTRDLDVYLLNFAHYKASLPQSMREDLNPLQEFLQRKQAVAQQELASQLQSKKYLTPLINWEQFLTLPAEQTVEDGNAKLSIKQLADFRIWKTYQRAIKHGMAINEHSPAAALHDLRKTCKKLRYLIEFFQSLYPAAEIKTLIKNLKELQELLGDFQDCDVQERALKHFSEEMRQNGCPEQTFLAIDALVQVLETKRCKARADFGGCFAVFAAPQNRTIFKSLFISKT
jgi:CHAD domain-containing protein